jgi:hypothetical protein
MKNPKIVDDDEAILLTEISPKDQRSDYLPPVDIDSGTKTQCLLAIFLGTLSSLVCVICGITFLCTSTRSKEPNGGEPVEAPAILLPQSISGEAISFAVNLILTQCLEGLAYVHSISLRWALLQENRLTFNTNLRLLTSSKLSRPNSWYINSISAGLLILCYGATSFLFPTIELEAGDIELCVNLIALLILGLALFGQTLLAIWCFYNNLRNIPSWSSNPLNTTVTMLRQRAVQHRENCCMSPIQTTDLSQGRPILPRTRQPSLWQVSTSARNVIIFTWVLVGLSFVWFLTIVFIARSRNSMYNMANVPWQFSLSWSKTISVPGDGDFAGSFSDVIFYIYYVGLRSETTAVVVIFSIICAAQALQTLGLHCAELNVNLSRDEDIWRALDAHGRSLHKGHVLKTPPFLAALKSWKYGMLLIFKSLLHWLLGQSMQPSIVEESLGASLTMNYARLFVYFICAAAFASFATFLTVRKPKGPQPATYGHIQTLADLVDNWTLDEHGCFWWGDKGAREGVRHAGMCSHREGLSRIRMNALYAGESSERPPKDFHGF